MYVEYCDHGDLRTKFENKKFEKQFEGILKNWVYLEEHIWSIFECLAKACCFLEKGTESTLPNAPDWGTPIIHLDVKPENGKYQLAQL